MYFILLLGNVFFFGAICLFALDLARIKRNNVEKWLSDDVWKDDAEWNAYRSKHNKSDIDLFV